MVDAVHAPERPEAVHRRVRDPGAEVERDHAEDDPGRVGEAERGQEAEPVRFGGERHASGERAVFDDAARTVTLSGRARLRDGTNEVAGERVVVYLDEQRSVVDGGPGRVSAILNPPREGAPEAPPTPADGH